MKVILIIISSYGLLIIMKEILSWNDIRKRYPNQFVLLDHCQYQNITPTKIITTQGRVVFNSEDGKTVYDEYRKRGKKSNMTFGHTSCEKLEAEEIKWLGIRFKEDDDSFKERKLLFA